MAQWTDYKYIVTNVRMTNDKSEIAVVRVTTYNSKTESLELYDDLSKATFAAMLPNNNTAITAPPSAFDSSRVEIGAEICVIKPRNGGLYLRTKPDGIAKDDLGNLPLF